MFSLAFYLKIKAEQTYRITSFAIVMTICITLNTTCCNNLCEHGECLHRHCLLSNPFIFIIQISSHAENLYNYNPHKSLVYIEERQKTKF